MTVVCTPEYPEHHPQRSTSLASRKLAKRDHDASSDDGEKIAGFVGNPSKADQVMSAISADDLEVCV